MTEAERSSRGGGGGPALRAARRVRGTGKSQRAGWVLGGVGGVVGAVFAAAIFLVVYWALTKEGESTNGRVIGLAVCVGVTLLVFLSVTLSG